MPMRKMPGGGQVGRDPESGLLKIIMGEPAVRPNPSQVINVQGARRIEYDPALGVGVIVNPDGSRELIRPEDNMPKKKSPYSELP